MTDNTTIDEIYAALNPIPELLSAKGKVRPEVNFILPANAEFSVFMTWVKDNPRHDYDTDFTSFRGEDFADTIAKVTAHIAALPSAKDANLFSFMSKLGEVIDAGKASGIDVDYLNPLVDTMKRLSENVITYRGPASAEVMQ